MSFCARNPSWSPAAPRRSGVGVLLIVLLAMLLVMGIAGMAQRSLTSAVSNQALRSSLGNLSMEFAESAVEDVLHQLRRDSNDPTKPIFRLLRHDVYAGQKGDLDLSSHLIRPPPHTVALFQDPLFARFRIGADDVQARVVYQRQFDDLPYERFGLIEIKCKVTHDLSITESLGREVTVGVPFKVVLVGPPRPFDQAGFLAFVDNPQAELSYQDLNARRGEWIGLVRDVLEAAQKYANAPATPASSRSEYEQVRGLLKPVPHWEEKTKPYPEDRAVVFATRGGGAELKLEELDILPTLLEKEKSELVPARQAVDTALFKLNSLGDNDSTHRALAAALRQTAVALSTLMTRIQESQETFRVWGGPPYEELARFTYKMRADHWTNKAFYTISERRPESLDAQLRRLLSRVKPLNGIVHVDNPTQPFNLVGLEIPGKSVFVVGSGGVRLGSLNRNERPQDLLTVVALGGSVSIEDNVHAAVICGETRPSVRAGATLRGALVCERLPSRADRTFKVIRAEKYFSGITRADDPSGAFPDYYYAALSPQILYKQVARK